MQRFTRLSLASLTLGATLTVSSQTPPSIPPPGTPAASVVVNDGQAVTITINDGSIDHMLGLVEAYTGRVLLRPPNLPAAKYTLKLDKPMPKPEAMLAVETLLNLNGVGLVPLGDKFIKVVPVQQVRYEAPEIISGSSLELPASGRVATKIFQLDFIRASEFLQQFNTLFNPNLGTQPVPFEKTNAVMVTDSVSTLQRIELLLQQIDHPAAVHNGLKFYTARHAKASDLVTKLRGIMQGGLQQQMGNNISLNADDRTNQIVLISDPRQHAFFDTMIEKLDIKADPNTRNEVIYLKQAAAKDVATLISNIVSEKTKASTSSGSVRPNPTILNNPQPQQPNQPPQPTSAPPETFAAVYGAASSAATSQEFSANISIQPDERSNAIVVSGTVDDIRLIKELVDKIDILLAQVRIEMIVAEITLENDNETGINKLGLIVSGDKLVGFSGEAPGATASDGRITKQTRTVDDPTDPSGKRTIIVPGKYDFAGTLALSRYPTSKKFSLLQNPSITTTHNKEATLIVGDQVPQVGSYISGNNNTPNSGLGNVQVNQRDIGLTLKVKPLIGSDGSVQMEIKQELSEPGPEVDVGGTTQTTVKQRKTETFVSAKSGEIIVLGGLRRQNTSKTKYRFGPIPIIGDLLGGSSKSNDKTELVIFLRPTVLTTTAQDNSPAFKQTDNMPVVGPQVREYLDLPPVQSPEAKPAPALKRPR